MSACIDVSLSKGLQYERFMKQNVCKLEPKMNYFLNVRVKGGFKTKMPWDGERKYFQFPSGGKSFLEQPDTSKYAVLQ